MSGVEESSLEAAERQARESRQHAEQSRQRREAEETAAGQVASEKAKRLIDQCLERLAQAGWPKGRDIAVLEPVVEATGFLRMRQEERVRFVNREAWVAPTGVGYKTGMVIGTRLTGGWEKVFRDSQLALDRVGEIFHGAFSAEKGDRTWSRLDPPANETQVEALTEVLGAILAEYVPA